MATQSLNVENCRSKLNPVHAEFLDGSESRSIPLDDTKELRIGFKYSVTDNFDELERFIQQYTWPTNKEPQRYVSDFKVHGVAIEGVWRQAYTSRIERMNSQRQTEFLLVVTLRKGWATSIKWDEALLMQQRETDGNSQEVIGVANTASFDHAKVMTVRFPNVAPSAVQSCLASIPASISANSATLQGVKLTDLWYRAVAVANKTDDGTSTIDLTITRNRYTVELYQAYGTPAQRLGYRIYDVPRAVSSTIAESWKATGRTADISLSLDRDLCVVTLWANTETDSTFSMLTGASCAFYTRRTVYDNVEERVALPENSMGITYSGIFQMDPQTGRYNGWVEKRVRQTLIITEYVSDTDSFRYVKSQSWDGVWLDGSTLKKAVLSIATGEVPEGETEPDGEAGDILVTLSTITELATILTDTTEPNAGGTASTAGARSISVRPNEDCTLTIVLSTETERTVAAAAKTTTADAFSKRVVAVARGIAAANKGDDVVELNGTQIKILKWEKDRLGLYTKEDTTIDPNAADSDWIPYEDRYGTSYYRWFRNQTLSWITSGPVDDMDDTTSNSLSVSINEHSLYSGVATRQAYNEDGGYGTFFRSSRVDSAEREDTKREEVFDDTSKVRKLVNYKRTITILWKSVIVASYDEADDTLSEYRALTTLESKTPIIFVEEPKATMVADPSGRRGIRVEAKWVHEGDWEVVPAPAPAE